MNLDIRICLEFSALSLGFDLGIASSSLTSWGIPRNDGRGGYCECSELISPAENTK